MNTSKSVPPLFFHQLLGMKAQNMPVGHSYPVWVRREGFETYIHHLRRQCHFAKQTLPDTHEIAKSQIEKQTPLLFQEFTQILKGKYQGSPFTPSIPDSFKGGQFVDYLNYLGNQQHAKQWFLSAFDVFFNRKDRDKHVFCIGQTGSGKSEALKLLFLDTLYRRNVFSEKRSIVLMEPHGDLAEECARILPLHQVNDHINKSLARVRALSNKYRGMQTPLVGQKFQPSTTKDLILIDPGLDPSGKRFVCINIFDIENKKLNQAQIDAYAQAIVRSLSSMVSADSQSFTANMISLLVPLVTVLLHRKGSTLHDLSRFLIQTGNEDLVSLGKQTSNPAHQHFFHHLFDGALYRPTRQALSIRLQLLLNDYQFANLLAAGESSIDLEAALNQGKVIIINLSKLGLESQQAASRLFHGAISGIVRARIFSSKPRIPVDYLLDEFQNMVSSDLGSILVEARKYALHTVLATQTLDHLPRDLAKVVLANTAVKIVGKVGYSSRATLARELFTTPDTFKNLSTGRFIVQSGDAPYLRVQFTPRFIKHSQSISKGQWQAVKRDQLRRYYREPTAVPGISSHSSPIRPKYQSTKLLQSEAGQRDEL